MEVFFHLNPRLSAGNRDATVVFMVEYFFPETEFCFLLVGITMGVVLESHVEDDRMALSPCELLPASFLRPLW